MDPESTRSVEPPIIPGVCSQQPSFFFSPSLLPFLLIFPDPGMRRNPHGFQPPSGSGHSPPGKDQLIPTSRLISTLLSGPLVSSH
ncbi:hypothetical protein AVEN_194716-1 [Araneus ventricosus]|uniref:Uncharacterized protein n=1 Tax=Araneus ventricosus TaxID=182803 RepID=A0A4Y2RFY4_ARAVE|nr:hypothetical protein AVEN_194716-1 [Araneus ventricosus]